MWWILQQLSKIVVQNLSVFGVLSILYHVVKVIENIFFFKKCEMYFAVYYVLCECFNFGKKKTNKQNKNNCQETQESGL